MSKTIKLKEETYNELEGLLRPRETFDEAVGRLLLVYRKSGELLNVLEGQVRFQEERLTQLERLRGDHGRVETAVS